MNNHPGTHGAHNLPLRTHPYNGREDCWSEAATATLIKAWGDRYLLLNRGNLRQKDWKDVSDAVNSNGVKPPKTDVQCKNRIDTIKKKYKLEKSKPPPSNWPFFSRLDHLIGSSLKYTPQTLTPSLKPLSVTYTVKPYPNPNPNPNPNANRNVVIYSGAGSSRTAMPPVGSVSDDEEDEEDVDLDGDGGDDDEEDDVELGGGRKKRVVDDLSDGAAFRELARAIVKFGEVYERIESSKQEQMMELERQRMEFTKDLEFQRMQMFLETQLELEKMKRPKYASSNGKKL